MELVPVSATAEQVCFRAVRRKITAAEATEGTGTAAGTAAVERGDHARHSPRLDPPLSSTLRPTFSRSHRSFSLSAVSRDREGGAGNVGGGKEEC